MPNFRQGIYTPLHPEKYVGHGKIKYRSGWEMTFMIFLDNNANVLQWASESVRIPYRHPLTGKITMYVPDFLVTYRGANNTVRAELIEIKPKKQSLLDSKMSDRDRAIVAVNYCKWSAAQAWCKNSGLTFRVITESDLFRNGGK